MSRRSRQPSISPRRRILWWFISASIALLFVAFIGGYIILRKYLYSDGFRKFLSAEVSKTSGLEGEFSPFNWDGLSVESPQFQGRGTGSIRSLQAKNIHSDISLSEVRRGVWKLEGTQIDKLEIQVDGQDFQLPKREKNPEGGWLPQDVEFSDITLNEVFADVIFAHGNGGLAGSKVKISPQPYGVFDVAATGGKIILPNDFLKSINLNSLDLVYRKEGAFIKKIDGSIFESGKIAGTGEWDAAEKHFLFDGNASGLKAGDLLSPSWAKRLAGTLSSTVVMDSNEQSSLTRGALTLKDGVLTALPLLDALAAYADTRRFREIAFDAAHTDWEHTAGTLKFQNLVLASEGLLRCEGNLTIKQGELDGKFRIGLPPGTFARIPGAEKNVFVAGENGLLWTTVVVSGTLEKPKEDLTGRLLAAAGARMLELLPETGEKILKYGGDALKGVTPDVLQQGAEQGEKAITDSVKHAKGILDGLFEREKEK